MERVEIAPDGWTFRGAKSGAPFVPFGTNYTAAWAGWPPDYLGEAWDERRLRADLDAMRALGVNTLKFVAPLGLILPDPQQPGAVRLDERTVRRLARAVELAGERGIRLIVCVHPGWRSLPQWFYRGGGFFGEESLAILEEMWRELARRFAGDGRILAYSFCVETALGGWRAPQALALFGRWAVARYGSLERANAAWGTQFARVEDIVPPGEDGNNSANWRELREGTPGNENKTNDPFLYDYLLFREWAAFRFVFRQSRAVKAADPGALTTMGFVQWNPILRQLWKPVWEGPARGPEYNVREIARALDFVGIHFYPVYPPGDEEKQLRYLQIWARWADVGKPVVLEEFNRRPREANARWCERVVRETRGFVSGWLVWAFQDVPEGDAITRVCGLLDAQGRRTPWGERFAALAPEVRRWRLQRPQPRRVVRVDKRWLYTSSDYRALLDGLLEGDPLVRFELEPNPAIDALLAGEEL